jgi:hypothetical protein
MGIDVEKNPALIEGENVAALGYHGTVFAKFIT